MQYERENKENQTVKSNKQIKENYTTKKIITEIIIKNKNEK